MFNASFRQTQEKTVRSAENFIYTLLLNISMAISEACNRRSGGTPTDDKRTLCGH